MSTLRAVNSQADATTAAEVTETTSPDVEYDNREAYDPRIDPEAKLLCALMWCDAPAGRIAQVLEFLTPEDFNHYAHARLFSLIVEQYQAGAPLDGTLIASKCDAAGVDGREGWPAGKTPQQFIVEISSLDARPMQITYLAESIIGASYRRQFRSMALHLTQAAEDMPEADLFPLMVEQGRRQRTAKARLDAFRRTILGRDDQAIIDGEVVSDDHNASAEISEH